MVNFPVKDEEFLELLRLRGDKTWRVFLLGPQGVGLDIEEIPKGRPRKTDLDESMTALYGKGWQRTDESDAIDEQNPQDSMASLYGRDWQRKPKVKE